MSETGPEPAGQGDEGQPGSGHDAGSPWARPGVITLRCRENGPLVVEVPGGGSSGGPGFRVIDHEGCEFQLPLGKRAVALCRCGRSGTRPFCDGSHKDGGFRAAETAAATRPGGLGNQG